MKAKAVKCFDETNPETDVWSVMIQIEKYGIFNTPLKGNGNNVYSTLHEIEAREKAKSLNEKWGS